MSCNFMPRKTDRNKKFTLPQTPHRNIGFFALWDDEDGFVVDGVACIEIITSRNRNNGIY